MNYESVFKEELEFIDVAIRSFLPNPGIYPQPLHEAMNYAVLSGGKRFRPALVVAACTALGGHRTEAVLPAVALELIHCYSLVQDDLPALDNDDFRRGQPTCHKKFGEATALLASDGLLTQAFELLARVKPAERAVKLIAEISTAAGTYGMIGGQAADLDALNRPADAAMLDFVNIHKTGKLIKAAAVSGALAAGATGDSLRSLERYGEMLGLAFQCVDDLDDGDGYLRHMTFRELEEKTRALLENAKREVDFLGSQGEKLIFLANFLEKRIPQKST